MTMAVTTSATRAKPPNRTLRVWVVEDNDLLRDSIQTVLESAPGVACPIAAASCEEALAALYEEPEPEVVLMDIGLPGISGIEGARQLRSRAPSSRVVMLTVHDDSEHVFQALCAGASGYLLKPSSADQIVAAIRDIERGAAPINGTIARKILELFSRLAPSKPRGADYGLTPREQEILHLLVEGLTMRRIADHLGVSYHTVDTHIRHLYDKLHVHSRSKAVAKALQEQLV